MSGIPFLRSKLIFLYFAVLYIRLVSLQVQQWPHNGMIRRVLVKIKKANKRFILHKYCTVAIFQVPLDNKATIIQF